VYLVDAKDAKKALPFTAAQAKALGPKVAVDQPCCMFVPHVAVAGPGQALVFKNPAPVTHNVKMDGGDIGPNLNQGLSPRTNLEVPAAKLKPRLGPILVTCSIHNWMKCYVFVLDHPYFAVTDENGKFEIKNAPAGKYRLIVWQGGIGWGDAKSPLKGGGKPITVAGPTDVGQIKMKPADD
jgi:plastocyanin